MKRGYLSLPIVGVAACVAVWAFTTSGGVSEMNNGINLSSTDIAFQKYMTKHGKSYATKEEYLYRKEIFEQYLNEMSEHNSQNGETWTMAINKFSDMTQ